MNINLTHFRNILGKKNDGTVVFTRNNGQVTGIEKANYGSTLFGSLRHIRATTPDENKAMRKLFVQTIVASANADKPLLTASTLSQIKVKLGLVQGANPLIDLIGRPARRQHYGLRQRRDGHRLRQLHPNDPE